MSSSSTSSGSVARARGFDLPGVLANLRRDIGEPERPIHILLGLSRDANLFRAPGLRLPSRAGLEDAVLAQLHSLLNRDLAEPDVVLLGAGEIVERRAV